jgi:pimeloyl-ACP methyl ester carboxylesterase
MEGPKISIVVVGSLVLSAGFFGLASVLPAPDAVPTLDEGETPGSIASVPATAEESTEEPEISHPDARCPDGFECVTIEARIDHYGSDVGTVPVTFAVLPSTGTAEGAVITIVGGPGASGIEAAEYTAPALEPLRAEYDLVFFDMRGLEVWKSIDCPAALAANNEGYWQLPNDPEERWVALDRLYQSFGEDCAVEARRPVLLEHLRTIDVARDVEAFRRHAGYEKVILYGQSYGTQVARQYARSHPDRVERMILDGVVDDTRYVHETVEDRIAAFEGTLAALFAGCDADDGCSFDMAAPAATVYEELVEELTETPAIVQFPVDGETTEEVVLTAEGIAHIAFSSLYEPSTRMAFMRALAAYANRADLVPFVRFLATGHDSGIDPIVNIAVACTDGAYPGITATELNWSIEDAREAALPEHRWFYESVLSCVHWPHIDHFRGPSQPFPARGIPTLILASDTDVATPYKGAVAAHEALEEGHLITVRNGPHVLFGRGIDCIDDAMINFALEGAEPPSSECSLEVMDPYVTLLPTDWSLYTPEEMIGLAEAEIYLLPELMGWAGLDPITVGCGEGGSFSFTDDAGTTSFDLMSCGLGEGLVLSGTGEIDWIGGSSSMEVKLGATGCNYAYSHEWATTELTIEESC